MIKVNIAPKDYVIEELFARGWSINDFRLKLGLKSDIVIDFLQGGVVVDDMWAEGLSIAFGTSKDMWINLQKGFEEYERTGKW